MKPLASPPSFVLSLRNPTPCAEEPELFHHPDDGPGQRGAPLADRITKAKDRCLDCPLMLDCRQWARDHREFGIWGGEDDDERAEAGYAPRLQLTSKRPPCGTDAGAAAHRRALETVCPACAEAAAVANAIRGAARRAARKAEMNKIPAKKTRQKAWPPRLTTDQQSLLTLLAMGLDRSAIATRLGAHRRAVGQAVRRLAAKLRTTPDGIVPTARRLGLLPATRSNYKTAA